jgi:protein CpxP
MKKTIIALAVVMLAGTASSFAQGGGGGGFQMPTPEERVKRVHFKVDSAFKLEETKMKQVEALYLDYYKQQDKVREEVMANGGGGGFQVMQEKMKPYTEELDTKLKPVLGDDNFKIWKEQIEPTLRRRGGGGQKNN